MALAVPVTASKVTVWALQLAIVVAPSMKATLVVIATVSAITAGAGLGATVAVRVNACPNTVLATGNPLSVVVVAEAFTVCDVALEVLVL